MLRTNETGHLEIVYSSDSIATINRQIEQARHDFKALKKSGENTFFQRGKNKQPHRFSTLEDIFDACQSSLCAHGVNVIYRTAIQPSSHGVDNILVTTLYHQISEEFISSASLLNDDGKASQGIGSAITYMRRYQLQALLNLEADFEDDGNVASGNTGEKALTSHSNPSRVYKVYDSVGQEAGTYTKFQSYESALEDQLTDPSCSTKAWAKATQAELEDIVKWANAEAEATPSDSTMDNLLKVAELATGAMGRV